MTDGRFCRRCAAREPRRGLTWCEQCVREWFDQLISEIGDVPRRHPIDGTYEAAVAREEGSALSVRADASKENA